MNSKVIEAFSLRATGKLFTHLSVRFHESHFILRLEKKLLGEGSPAWRFFHFIYCSSSLQELANSQTRTKKIGKSTFRK